MRKPLVLLTVAVLLAVTASTALAYGSSVDGTVTQKFPYSDSGTTLIAVDGQIYPVPFEFYNEVQVGAHVEFDGANWMIAK